MKAAILTDWERIEIREIEKPVPAAGEVLIEVSYGGICGSDVHIFRGDNPIARTPVTPGHEFTGRVAALGDGVASLSVGQRVAVQPLTFCGACTPCLRGTPHVCEELIVIGVNQDGGFAQFVRIPSECAFQIPDTLPDEASVLAEPFSIAMHASRRGQLASDDQVLVSGAGPIGLYCAVVAREMGVRSICISEPSLARREFAQSFGFETVTPVEDESVAAMRGQTGGQGFDLVIETSGVSAGLDFATEVAAVRGRIVTLGFPHHGYAPYNITRGILKELSLVGSRVCTRAEFQDTLGLLYRMHRDQSIDFGRLVAEPRGLRHLSSSIRDVASASEAAKILIRPE